MSTTTSSCVTPPNVAVCVPTPPTGGGVYPPVVTIDDLLELLKKKCDKDTCQIIQYEVDLLYTLLGITKPTVPSVPVVPGTPGNGGGTNPGTPTNPIIPGLPGGSIPIPPIHFDKFQTIKNMVDKLDASNQKDKYPTAELLKEELKKLWRCMTTKADHHGTWVDNWTYRDVVSTTDACAFEHGKDPAPGKIKVITPVDVGSTVFHTVKDENGHSRTCLFESLVDNNIVEPSKLSVLDGKWLNYCDIKDVIDCVLPRKKITDCKAKCDDPNGDGVHEDKKLCERVKCIEKQICNTDCKVGVPTLCERVTKNTTDIATNKANIASNLAKINNNTTHIATNTAGIATNKTAIGHNASAIATNKTAIGHNTSGVAANKATGAANKATGATNKAAIAHNKSAIATNLGHIDHGAVAKFELVSGAHGPEYKLTMKGGRVLTAKCCAADKVVAVSDGTTFKGETKSGGVDQEKFTRIGSVTVPAGTPRSLFQVNSSNAAYAQTGGATAELPGTATTVSSAYMGYRVIVTRAGHKTAGRQAWANDHDTVYKGNTADMVAHMSEQMILVGGDVLTLEVEYGDHSQDQHLPAMAKFDFKANSAYIDLLQIKTM